MKFEVSKNDVYSRVKKKGSLDSVTIIVLVDLLTASLSELLLGGWVEVAHGDVYQLEASLLTLKECGHVVEEAGVAHLERRVEPLGVRVDHEGAQPGELVCGSQGLEQSDCCLLAEA